MFVFYSICIRFINLTMAGFIALSYTNIDLILEWEIHEIILSCSYVISWELSKSPCQLNLLAFSVSMQSSDLSRLYF